jgi:predicted alpha/beta hydrolase family esterase
MCHHCRVSSVNIPLMHTYIIIHGTKGSPEGNWFPWLASHLRQRGASVLIPRMPTPEEHSLENWLRAFSAQCGVPNDTTTLIGHSLGATFLLRYLERASQPVHRAIFIAGVIDTINIPEFDRLNASFISAAFDWKAIVRNSGAINCFYGEDDPYVPLDQSLELARCLGVTPERIPKGGHLNAESGYTTFPSLLESL